MPTASSPEAVDLKTLLANPQALLTLKPKTFLPITRLSEYDWLYEQALAVVQTKSIDTVLKLGVHPAEDSILRILKKQKINFGILGNFQVTVEVNELPNLLQLSTTCNLLSGGLGRGTQSIVGNVEFTTEYKPKYNNSMQARELLVVSQGSADLNGAGLLIQEKSKRGSKRF